MAGLSSYAAQNTLNYHVGKTAMPTLPTAFLALFTVAPSDSGGGTEVTGGAYARVSTAAGNWNAAAGSAPSTITNSAVFTFPTATANWGTVVAFAGFDASSAGNMLWWDFLGNFSWLPFTGSLASPSVLTSPAHGYANGDSVTVTAEYGGTLPATGGSWSGILTVASVTTDTFTAGVNTTGTGNGMVRKVASQQIPSGVQASFAASALTLSLT
jgi:hypothetical protein